MEGKQTVVKTTGERRAWFRSRSAGIASAVLVVVIAFGLGLNIGNGRLSLPGGARSGSSLPATLDYSSVSQVYQSLKNNYDGKLTEQQLENGLKHGLAQATNDPYTEYFTPAEAKDFNSQLNGSFSGIGAELGKDSQGTIQVISPIAGKPAEKAGLKAKDLIAEIDGKSTTGFSVDQAVSAIRGKAGTTVKLGIIRGNSPLTLSITRNNIQIPSVTTKTLDGNVGYIQITTFGDDTSRLIDDAANKFKQAGVKGVVLDLRNNPGGEVDAAVAVSSQWLPTGTLIMQEKTGNTVTQSYTSTGTAQLKNIPTVVLINGGSASASEITAAALHDNKQATVIGEKSYGKGVVQRLIQFNDDSQLKVTVASWYRPNGKNINHRGITPDQTVKLTDADAGAGTDTQLQAAQTYLAQH